MGSATIPPPAGRRLRVVLLLRSLGYVRLFDPVIRGLLARGHEVHLLHERDAYTGPERAWLLALEEEPGFTWTLTTTLYQGGWAALAKLLRRSADYVHFLGPGFRGAEALVGRAESRAHPHVRRLLRLRVLRLEPVRSRVARLLDLVERALPRSRELEAELGALRPDVLVLVPHLMPGGRHSEYVRACRDLGIPTCVCIASWDNLSSKQLLRDPPDRVVVWNRFQRDEAIRLHAVPEDRIVITGAQSFDQWFERVPSDRETFCRRVGLDPHRPFVLFVGGALFPGAQTEAEYVANDWIPELRSEPRLADLQVLARPHPRRREEWSAVSFEELADVSVWPSPADVSMPVDEETRADFFDAIHHSAAVVGINTTAMIEAAAVGRPVHALRAAAFSDSQDGTYHFDYLLEVGGGLVTTAATAEEHHEQLLGSIEGLDEGWEARRAGFLGEFVRPHGLEVSALPLLLEAVEELAGRAPAAPERESLAVRLLRPALRIGFEVARRGRRLLVRPVG